MEHVVFDKEKPSDYSAVLVFEGERTILVYHEKRKYDVPDFNHTHWLMLGAIGQNPTKVHSAVNKHIKKSRAKLAFNPGPVQIQQGRKKLAPLLRNTHVLFMNKEEAHRLAGSVSDIPELLLEVKKCGPEIVVITDGKNGSFCYDGMDRYFMPAHKGSAVDATGCGDAYATGFIGGLYNDVGIKEAMMWGTINAASVLKHVGAQKGLLSKNQIMKKLKSNSFRKPKKI